jgi:alpha-galactosidase
MTLWAMLAAPLLAGNNLTAMTPEVAAILMNKQVIAIDQDPLGKQGERILQEGPIQVWSRPLADGSVAVAIFNTGEDLAELRTISIPWQQLGFMKPPAGFDIWANKPVGKVDARYHPSVTKHGVVLLKLTK